jgi:CBS domain-containing protein
MDITVNHFMHQPVVSLALPNDVGNARDLMKQKECHAIPLVEVDDEKNITIRGIVTSDDLMGVHDDTVSIEQIMTTKVLSVTPDTSAQAAAQLMIKHQLHHLLVMEGQRIVGMISSMDFVGLVADPSLH